MAIKSTDPEEIISAANVTISAYMNGDIMDVCKDIISNTVHATVYPAYDPDVYKRREDAGGLSDKREYYTEEDGNPWGYDHQIRIFDDRHEVGVVTFGTGYTWKRSRIYKMQPFPRPYFSRADKEVQAELETMIQAALSGV